MKFLKQYFIQIILIALLIADLCYSYSQYSLSTIDGDFPSIVMGTGSYEKVMSDPLGFAALSGEKYAATNRFAAHAVMSGYFKSLPIFLQNFVSPIDSIYLAIAITKLLVHILLLGILSYIVSGFFMFNKKIMLCAAVLISPLFHDNPIYREYLQIINPCITYVMFYALPMATVLLFLLPFYRYLLTGKISKSPLFIVTWIIFAFFLSLFGPLPAPILLVTIIIIFGHLLLKNFYNGNNPDQIYRFFNAIKSINTTVLIIFSSTLLVNLYSMYIGTKNEENDWFPMPLEERFSKLFEGLKIAFFNVNSGLLYILLFTGLNLILLYIFYRKKHRQYFKLVFFLILFCGLYILMLPLGGYRAYRPFIVRWDTLTPVLCILFFCWATSGILLISNLNRFKKIIPLLYILPLMFYYKEKDVTLEDGDAAITCEIAALQELATTKQDCVTFDRKCWIAGWGYNITCEESAAAAKLFNYYNITSKEIYYRFNE